MADLSAREIINGNMESYQPSSCSSCGTVDIKYRCPRCDVKTCSLACVKKHKVINSCSGQRDKTKHVARSAFNEKNLLNDYRFLEEGHRVADNAQRDQNNKQNYNFSRNVKKLRSEAGHRGVKLRLMPVGFQKRKENTSCFHFKTKVILWRIKWEFPEANVEYVEAKLSENKSIKSLLEKYLHPTLADPVFKQKLKSYRDEEIRVFLRNYSTHHASFFEIDTSITVKEALKGKVVIEYPTFNVVLSRHCSEYPTDIPCSGVKRQRLENQDDTFLIKDKNDAGPGSCSKVGQVTMKCDVVNVAEIEEEVRETNPSKTSVDEVKCKELTNVQRDISKESVHEHEHCGNLTDQHKT